MAKKDNKKLQEVLFSKKEGVFKNIKEKDYKKVFSFAEKYKTFIDASKTARGAAKTIEAELLAKGFKELSTFKSLKKGDKVYSISKGRLVLCGIVGDFKQIKIIGSHIDSPRLDLKPNPLYEDSGLAMLKTHYYGGIKKYQWANIPLCLQGVMYTKNGKKVEINIGSKDSDPIFLFPDLLAHLSKKQMDKNAREVITGENLQVIAGSIPVDDKDIKEQIKFSVMKYLNDEFGIVEDDFFRAELELVPANNARDVGFDRGMISSYGHDNKSCAYASLAALMECKNQTDTLICAFFDKEEIGSTGPTGATTFVLENFTRKLIELSGSDLHVKDVLEQSKIMSADVTDGLNPLFKEVHDGSNAPYINKGIGINKYSGHGGKYGGNDCDPEFVAKITSILDKEKITWQITEMGRVDEGGGGTIAAYVAKYGCDVIDAGCPVMSMHSPYEVISKFDLYETYRTYKAFYEVFK